MSKISNKKSQRANLSWEDEGDTQYQISQKKKNCNYVIPTLIIIWRGWITKKLVSNSGQPNPKQNVTLIIGEYFNQIDSVLRVKLLLNLF